MPKEMNLLGGKPAPKKDVLTLYHGSKGGIYGRVSPTAGRDYCDFGHGFYTGTLRVQAFGLALRTEDTPRFYTCQCDMAGLRVESLAGFQWLFYVLYNRGQLEEISESKLYKSLSEFHNGVDVIHGMIADDRMSNVFQDFIEDRVTDVVVYQSLSLVDLGEQYVFLTPRACSHIDVHEVLLTEKERLEVKAFNKEYKEKKRQAYEDAYDLYRFMGKGTRALVKEFINSDFKDLPATWKDVLRRYQK